MPNSEMAVPPRTVAEAAADLGHAALEPAPGAFVPSFRCPTCGARADWNVSGWTGWAIEETHERVISATRPQGETAGGEGRG